MPHFRNTDPSSTTVDVWYNSMHVHSMHFSGNLPDVVYDLLATALSHSACTRNSANVPARIKQNLQRGFLADCHVAKDLSIIYSAHSFNVEDI